MNRKIISFFICIKNVKLFKIIYIKNVKFLRILCIKNVKLYFLVLTYILKIYKIIIGEFNEKKNISRFIKMEKY